VTSKDGEGSTFTFTIPVEEIPGTLQAPVHTAESHRGILVISNHELGCEVLAEQVRHLGYECSTALGCQQGLKMLDKVADEGQQQWSYILVDQDVLPEDTPLIVDFLNKVPEAHRPEPILMTSLSSIMREQDLKRKGFTRTLTKPVRPHRLAEVLNGYVSQDRPEAAIQDPEPGIQTSSPQTEDNSHGPLVLLAEDNPFNQKVALGMLKLLGCRVEVANNGVEALDLVGKNDYRVVFMDCQMPEMDGYEATERIRQIDGDRSATPIIAMTANALSGDRRACFASGMNDFLSKPITKAKLGEMLAKWDVVAETVDA
jgi:CheY-like chemotaxis protein